MAYAFRKLKPYERNYPSHYLELAILIFTLKIWRHFLFGETYVGYIHIIKSEEVFIYSKEIDYEAKR